MLYPPPKKFCALDGPECTHILSVLSSLYTSSSLFFFWVFFFRFFFFDLVYAGDGSLLSGAAFGDVSPTGNSGSPALISSTSVGLVSGLVSGSHIRLGS